LAVDEGEIMKIVKIPYSESVNGVRLGPDKIVEKLKDIYSNEDGKVPDFEIDKVEISSDAHKKIYEKVLKEKDCIVLGGDHSITYPCFKAFASKYKNPGLLVFDSHPDCANPKTPYDFVGKLVEEGLLKTDNIVIVGLSNIMPQERKFLEKNKIDSFLMKDIFGNIENICDGVMELVNHFDGLYLSIDIDVLDPAFAPGTGTISPGGMTSRELIYFVQRLKKLKNLRMVDIVEVNPDKDVNDMTSILAAKLIFELS